MKLPRHDQMHLPILEILDRGGIYKSKQLEDPLANVFNLSEEDLNIMYNSGNGPIFIDRINWALSYLNMAGLVQKPKRGLYQINEEGKKALLNKVEIPKLIKTRVQNKTQELKEKNNIDVNDINSDLTPEEALYVSFNGIKQRVYNEILDTILSKTPLEFEKLVVELLQKMGYGDQIKDAGMVTQYTNDGGIDGIVKEDILGFGRIHIQAKRYERENSIGREDIQKFVGALAVAQSDKGVFITTSKFTKSAIEYVANLSSTTKIVLINGQKLAEYIYEYDLGMQTEKVIKIKKLDGDFWDELDEIK